MPYLNRTGPLGLGPMTGRGRGRCTNFNVDRSKLRKSFRKSLFINDEKKMLELELDAIKKRLEELNSK